MEKILKIEATEDTPKVVLNSPLNTFSLSGRSLPENAMEFYSPVIQWTEDYLKQPADEITVLIDLEYFNSSSAKQIFVFLLKFEKAVKAGKKVKVLWSYNADDDLMLLKGEELKEMIDLPVELKIKN